jgi:hypothetical protein
MYYTHTTEGTEVAQRQTSVSWKAEHFKCSASWSLRIPLHNKLVPFLLHAALDATIGFLTSQLSSCTERWYKTQERHDACIYKVWSEIVKEWVYSEHLDANGRNILGCSLKKCAVTLSTEFVWGSGKSSVTFPLFGNNNNREHRIYKWNYSNDCSVKIMHACLSLKYKLNMKQNLTSSFNYLGHIRIKITRTTERKW